jgi:hypothetical protein
MSQSKKGSAKPAKRLIGASASVAYLSKQVRKLSMRELLILFDAAQSAGDAWNGIACQPRARKTEAFEAIMEECGRCDQIRDLIHAEAKARQPKSIEDIKTRAWILIDRNITDDWRSIVLTALDAERAVTERIIVRQNHPAKLIALANELMFASHKD